jgi:hypothetical protein
MPATSARTYAKPGSPTESETKAAEFRLIYMYASYTCMQLPV